MKLILVTVLLLVNIYLLYFPTLLFLAFLVVKGVKKNKNERKKKQNKKTKTKSISSSENRALTIRFASLHYVSYATLILGAKWVFILALISFHVTSLLIKINTGVFLTNTKTMFVDRRNRNPLALLRFVSRNGQHRR